MKLTWHKLADARTEVEEKLELFPKAFLSGEVNNTFPFNLLQVIAIWELNLLATKRDFKVFTKNNILSLSDFKYDMSCW